MVVDSAVHRRVRGSDTPSTGNREPTGWGGTCNIRPTAAAFFTETPTRTDQITHTPGNLSPTRQPGAATILLTNPIIIASTDPCKHTTKQRHDTVQATTGPHSPPAPKQSATITTTPKATASRRIFRAAKQRNKRTKKQAAHHFLAAMTASPPASNPVRSPAPLTPRPPMTEPQAERQNTLSCLIYTTV